MKSWRNPDYPYEDWVFKIHKFLDKLELDHQAGYQTNIIRITSNPMDYLEEITEYVNFLGLSFCVSHDVSFFHDFRDVDGKIECICYPVYKAREFEIFKEDEI